MRVYVPAACGLGALPLALFGVAQALELPGLKRIAGRPSLAAAHRSVSSGEAPTSPRCRPRARSGR